MGAMKQEAIREEERRHVWQPPVPPLERRAIRLAAMQAATAFLAPRQDATGEDLTRLAEVLEQWVTR